MELKFRTFEKSKSLDQQRELFVECFPETIGSPLPTNEHYQWKFHSFPSDTKSYEYEALSEDEILGYYAAIPYPYNYFGKPLTAGMVCDVMTGVKARGKGVFTKLGDYSTYQFKQNGLAFSTGYPIRPEVIPGHIKVGWKLPFQIPMFGKFHRMNTFLSIRNMKFLVPFANLFLSLYNSILSIINYSSEKYKISNYSAGEIESIQGLEDFFQTWQTEVGIALDKSIKFLKWRLGAPGTDYQILVLREETRVIGYTILRNVVKEGIPCVGVLDFSILRHHKKSSKTLLREIDKAVKKSGAELILVMMMEDYAKTYSLFRNGYMKTPFPFSFIIKQFDEILDEEQLHNRKNWNLMWIDSDDL